MTACGENNETTFRHCDSGDMGVGGVPNLGPRCPGPATFALDNYRPECSHFSVLVIIQDSLDQDSGSRLHRENPTGFSLNLRIPYETMARTRAENSRMS